MTALCEAPALVLLDEVGTGTDPEEGSALGVAVVDYFRRVCNAQVMATTHYGGLKMYAGNEAGVINASVEFDEKTLRPTYRLLVGLAGSSSGLEIARRFGIPNEVIDTALTSVSESTRQASEYLQRIKQESQEAAELRRALEEERQAVAEKFAALDKEAERRERERQNAFESALAQHVSEFERRSKDLLSKVADRAERLKVEREAQKRAGELKREAQLAASTVSGAKVNSPAAEAVTRDIKVVRAGMPVSREPEKEEVYKTKSGREIAVGDKVKLKSFGSIGIVDAIKDDVAEVRVKSLRLREHLHNLQLVELAISPNTKSEKLANLRRSSGADFKVQSDAAVSELNVIGKTTDEAIDAVDKFLDEASLASVSRIRIIHGHGTGALRKAITEMLKGHPHVERFAPAPQDQGGSGATLAELKQ